MFTLNELQILWHLLSDEQKSISRKVAKYDDQKNLVARDMENHKLHGITEIKRKIGDSYISHSKASKNEK